MRLFLLLTFLSCVQMSIAQIFVEKVVPFQNVGAGEIVFADVDSDGDMDVLVSGQLQLPSNTRSTKLYINDGIGNFTEVTNTNFIGAWFVDAVFADANGDNIPDLFISGKDTLNNNFMKLYLNNGIGGFTEKTDANFANIQGAIAVTDFDGDNDQDVIIVGQLDSGASTSRLYTNDSTGIFTEVANTPFPGAALSAIAHGDVDGDNDEDVIITGTGSSGARLYTNNGTGTFTEVTTPFEGVFSGQILLSDINGDGHLDFIESGYGSSSMRITKTYTNNGTGTFTEIANTIEAVMVSEIALGDYDKDGDKDLIITGRNASFQKIGKLYDNDGTGSFTENTNENLLKVESGTTTFLDVDADGDLDLVMCGSGHNPPGAVYLTKFYLNTLPITSTDAVHSNALASLHLSPNPTADRVRVELNAPQSGNINILVYDINGRLVHHSQQFVNAGKVVLPLDISHLMQGIYVVQVTGQTTTKGLRLIIK